MSIREILKANLKFYRKKRGLTQEQLAEKINCNPKYISGIESRNKFPSAETIDALADALGISPAQLFDEKGSPKNTIAFDAEKFTDEVVDGLHALVRHDILNFLDKKLQVQDKR
ncbi:MAG: helix-turn-helix domain-containing protein [Treponema sp.]|nr:helix-turn-helix domain-containing protein [Treponema sp.]